MSALTIATTAMLTAALALPGLPSTAGADEPPCRADQVSCTPRVAARSDEDPPPSGRPRPGLHGEELGSDDSVPGLDEGSENPGDGQEDQGDLGDLGNLGDQGAQDDPGDKRDQNDENDQGNQNDKSTQDDKDHASAASAYDWGKADPKMGHEFDSDGKPDGWGLYESAGHAGNGQRKASQITSQGGELHIDGTANGDSGGMMGSAVQPKFGRWEVRMKVDKRGSGGAYHPVVALIPSGQAYNNGGGDLDFAETDAGSGSMYCFIHYNGKQDYLKAPVDLEQWHTYGIEVAQDHITWFIDGKVAMTDTNKGAVTGTPWTLNLQLDAYQPSGLAPSTMAVDYFRYYPLPDGGVKTLQGPAPQTSSYGG